MTRKVQVVARNRDVATAESDDEGRDFSDDHAADALASDDDEAIREQDEDEDLEDDLQTSADAAQRSVSFACFDFQIAIDLFRFLLGSLSMIKRTNL